VLGVTRAGRGGWRDLRFRAIQRRRRVGPFAVLLGTEQGSAQGNQSDGQLGEDYCRAERWVEQPYAGRDPTEAVAAPTDVQEITLPTTRP
jgi:hypothetical protein